MQFFLYVFNYFSSESKISHVFMVTVTDIIGEVLVMVILPLIYLTMYTIDQEKSDNDLYLVLLMKQAIQPLKFESIAEILAYFLPTILLIFRFGKLRKLLELCKNDAICEDDLNNQKEVHWAFMSLFSIGVLAFLP